ncbi:transcription termination factor MTERF15, mitochondrial [Manihot esculenta]|uniref:Uncharacterized protein n=1 Tax=Manihot esculenta TaxID=3983 RepID=A0A2C9VMI9_MANES|nr:transcription termination factor MTERF15, mitochondrial [Manihot esculenta]OAY46055.1 hypothetical protein MANES_07G112900v8 [Manihot esculenta]
MVAFLFRGTLQIPISACSFSLTSSTIQLGFIQNGLLSSVRSLSTSLKRVGHEQRKYPYTVFYLVNSFGFSVESAESISRKVNFESSKNPDAVVSLLTEHGFTKDHISSLIRQNPKLLLANPTKTLSPKLEFLRSIGFSGAELGKKVSWICLLLSRSLKEHIIPCYNILKSVVVSDLKVIRCLKKTYGVWFPSPKNLSVHLSTLREVGICQSIISYLLLSKPCLTCLKTAKFRQLVHKAIELGFDPQKVTFVHALGSLSCPNTWEQKIEVYRSFGLSGDEIWLAVRKFPMLMSFSREKITNTMDFLVNKMGWLPADVARVPSVLCYSLDKRIIPRCSVVKVLMLKGLVKREYSLAFVLTTNENYFLDLFVIRYQEEVPQLLSIFRGETNILDFDLDLRKNPQHRPLLDAA